MWTVTLESNGSPLTPIKYADLLNRGSLAAVTIRPSAFRVTLGQWVQFDAQARDEAGSLLPDVTLRWSLLDLNAGDLDPA